MSKTSEITVPELGKVDEVSLVEWKVSIGDEVQKGTEVAEIETMKSTFSVEAKTAGTVGKILVEQGEKADVSQPLAIVESR
ncbi:hypothetical protein K9M06_00170 [Candidatus Bipolaricaulota bacterium]|nr:hypothetical protein [Candidatus Bipolaricaulota bacterium]